MKALEFQEEGEFKFHKKYPNPQLNNKEVLVNVKACGLCGTDVHIYNGEFEADFPVVIGHEFSGIIEKVGSEVTRYALGDKVAVNPNKPCHNCEYCRSGKENLCTDLTSLGVNIDGGFAEFTAVPESSTYKIPKTLDFESGAFVEPLSCAIHGVETIEINKGDNVLVLGSGPTGLLLMQLAQLSGASKVISSDINPKRLKVANRLGASETVDATKKNLPESVKSIFDTKGADVVIEAVGSKTTMVQSLEAAKPGGNILWFGVSSPEMEVPIKPFEVYQKELTIQGSFVNPYTTQKAVKLLSEGKIKTDQLISHRFDLSQFDKAIDTYLNDDNRIKILMEP